ncbi:N-acetyltransferase 9 [Mortierella sp. AM989]|nr:N-acetyltransferase 9 [Mortierella sp. AM989]
MRANERIALVGQRCVLVPYLKSHVEHYNKWMQSPELLGESGSMAADIPLVSFENYGVSWKSANGGLDMIFMIEMTASEPLTLKEEYEMQESWRVDENKMVGDVNLFFNDHDDPHSAEIEIMIADPDYRRKGMGLEALCMMITYAYCSLGTTRITAKISTENKGSIQLFLSRLRFIQIGYSEIFEEVTLEKILSRDNVSDNNTVGEDVVTRAQFETLLLSEEDLDH